MYYLFYSTEGTSFTIPETGNVVTTYATTSKSVSPSGITVTLHNRDLLAKFHQETTEMIITRAGRYACMYLLDGLVMNLWSSHVNNEKFGNGQM